MPPVTYVARAFAPLLEAQPPPDPERFMKSGRDTSAQKWLVRLPRWRASKYWWPPKPPCITQWHSLDAIPAGKAEPMATYTLQVHDGNLFAGGIGGVICWDPDAQTWQTLNAGFGEPAWLGAPMVVSLASYNDGLYAVMANSTGQRLYRLAGGATVWEAQWDAPDGARSLLADSGMLYLGGSAGVSYYEEAAEGWYPIGQSLPATVSALARVGDEVCAGTFAGEVLCSDPATVGWVPATPPLPATHIYALQSFGEYLYIGTNAGFYRCWTATGQWNADTACDLIEPETGFPATLVAIGFHVYNEQLYVATPKGVRQFDAAGDQWSVFNAGLTDLTDDPLHAFALTTFEDHLIAGTIDGVYQYGCW